MASKVDLWWERIVQWGLFPAMLVGIVSITLSIRNLVKDDIDLSTTNRTKIEETHDQIDVMHTQINEIQARIQRIENGK